jgi:hypothetical protein
MTTLHTEAEAVHTPESSSPSHAETKSHAKTKCTTVMVFSQISESLSTKPLRHPKKDTHQDTDASDLKAIARAKKKGGFVSLKDALTKLGID